jgi:hypothetical protein
MVDCLSFELRFTGGRAHAKIRRTTHAPVDNYLQNFELVVLPQPVADGNLFSISEKVVSGSRTYRQTPRSLLVPLVSAP